MNYRRLMKDLPAAAEAERPLMIRAIGRSRRKKAMRALLERSALRSLPLAERRALAAALGDLGYGEALGFLAAEWGRLLGRRFEQRSLPEEEEALRVNVVEAVGKTAPRGDQEALAVLRRGALDEAPAVALAAIAGLGALGDAKSLPVLERHLTGPDPALSGAASRALAGIGGEAAERLLRSRLKSASPRQRIDAALALGLMKRRIGVLTLDGFLEEAVEPYSDGVAAAAALTELGRTNGLAYLSKILEGPNPGLRAEAIDLLGASRAPRAILPLADLLADPDPQTRLRAVRALERIGGDRAAFELRRRKDDAEQEVRLEIRRARARLGDYVLP